MAISGHVSGQQRTSALLPKPVVGDALSACLEMTHTGHARESRRTTAFDPFRTSPDLTSINNKTESKRYNFTMLRKSFYLAAFLLSGCGVYWNHWGPELELYEGATRTNQELATIDQGSGCWGCVKTIKRIGEEYPIYTPPANEPWALNYPNKLKLLPGEYEIAISARSRKSTTASYTGRVNLKSGHTYHVLKDVCFGLCFTVPSYTTFVWIEDSATGEVLLGTKM